MTVRVAVFGTSWWADAMYLPPISNHPRSEVVAVCGRNPETTAAFADAWNVPAWFTDADELFDRVALDAVVVATANDAHHPLAVKALDRGLHVLCEKPLGLDEAEAVDLAARARRASVHTLVPYTYHYMPMNRWVRRLIADGYVGTPLHANLRYYTDFGFDRSYSWRFDPAVAGSGIVGDIGSHWIHLARWLLDDVEKTVSARTSAFIEREPRPDGTAYERLEDSAALTVRYESGAYSVIHVSAVCWEGSSFGQSHHVEIHGTDGTIHATCDWDTVQSVRGMRRGDDRLVSLPIPDEVWAGARRESVHDTYRDVFRTTDVMTRSWLSAIAAGEAPGARDDPTFEDGLAVQRVVDAAQRSAADDGCAAAIAS